MVTLLEYLRRIMFWSIDYIKGQPVRKNYLEIKKILENPNNLKIKEVRTKNLDKLLKHSTNTTNFYKKYINYTSLNDFPVINKNIVLDNYEEFKSEKFINTKLHKASSSGSTGIPFSIYHNKNKKNRNTADTIYFAKKANSKIGDKLLFFKLWSNNHSISKLTLFIKNIMPHDINKASDKDIVKLISKIEKSKSNKYILGYPSFFNQICKYLDKNDYKPKINKMKSIISFAESLNDYEREKMGYYFSSPVYSRYSNRENGILAQQTKDSNGNYKLNWASYFFEILKPDSNEHVKSGELGRIVVTDLFNYSMPLIRYDTGDMAIYKEINYDNPVLFKVYGRRADIIYSTKGKPVSPFIFYVVLKYSNAKQFQFIQTHEKKYLFKLNGQKEKTKELEVIEYFKEYLGSDAIITFEYVNEIPKLSSGKRKEAKNEYKKN